MELALNNNNSTINNHLVMNKDQRVHYKYCTSDFEVDGLSSTPDSQNSRSPRCEAFLMTGDKMLNLNPKISPSYAKVFFLLIFYILSLKVCHDQLPPVVHDELEKKLKNDNQFDNFPSMHKNNYGRIRSVNTLSTTEEVNIESLSNDNKEKIPEVIDNNFSDKNFEVIYTILN